MAIWGVGAYWGNRDVSKEFVSYGTAAIGYKEEDKDTFHKRMRLTNPGDLIFIKSKFRENGKMHIKAIGIIVNANLCKENGYNGQDGIKVYWIRNLTDKPVEIVSPYEYGTTSTFYEEKKPEVIEAVLNLL